MLVVALVAFFVGGYRQRSEQLLLSQTDLKQLQAKDQMSGSATYANAATPER
jgi:hypothetical protein